MSGVVAGFRPYHVAPLAGAWIEMSIPIALTINAGVAPLAGAWIEMSGVVAGFRPYHSRSPCGSVD